MACQTEPEASVGAHPVVLTLVSGEVLQVRDLPTGATFAELIQRLEAVHPAPENYRYDLYSGSDRMSAKMCVEGIEFMAVVCRSCSEGDRVYAKYHDAFFLGTVLHVYDDEEPAMADVTWEEDDGCGPTRVAVQKIYLAEEVSRCEGSKTGVTVGDHVFVNWSKTNGRWPSELWPGQVKEVRDGELVTLQWEDGSSPSEEPLCNLWKHGKPCGQLDCPAQPVESVVGTVSL